MNKELLTQLNSEGFSTRQIADKLGRSQSAVYRALIRCGLHTRPLTIHGNCAECGAPLRGITKSNNKFCTSACFIRARHAAAKRKLDSDSFKTDASRRKALLDSTTRICAICGITEWCGQPIPVVMDHIDGNSTNNAVANLRLICCNCDAQLPTYMGRNRGNGRKARRERYQHKF